MTAPKSARASDALTRALINLAAAGERTHCSDPESHHLWLSDDESDRAVAAQLCIGCPVWQECGAAAKARRERFGVWASVDRTVRPGQKGLA
jgi:hypothetical protein